MKHLIDKTDNPFFTFLKPLEPLLQQYEDLIKQWQKAINLISSTTQDDIWKRHICDSAQLWPFIKKEKGLLIDLGSGAGFPGIVLALCNTFLKGCFDQVVLIESDTRKSIFLTEVIRVLKLQKTRVINARIEKIEGLSATVITARALADIQTLLRLSVKLRTPVTKCLFLKGSTAETEIEQIKKEYDVIRHPSQTNQQGVIVELREKKKE